MAMLSPEPRTSAPKMSSSHSSVDGREMNRAVSTCSVLLVRVKSMESVWACAVGASRAAEAASAATRLRICMMMFPTGRSPDGGSLSRRQTRVASQIAGRFCQSDDAARFRPAHQPPDLTHVHEPRLHGVIARDGFAGYPAGGVVNEDIVPARFREDAVDHVDQAGDLGLDPRLLAQFPQGGVDHSLAGLDPPAGKTPLPLPGRGSAPDQQHLVATEADDADGGHGRGKGGGHRASVAWPFRRVHDFETRDS